MDIVPMTKDNLNLLGKLDGRQLITELTVVTIAPQGFRLQYHKASKPYWRDQPLDDQLTEDFILSPDKAGFFALSEGRPVGQLVASSYWNNYTFVHELSVDVKSRRRGVGTALLSAAQTWSLSRGQYGLMLETQDVNATACQFYERSGFTLGGVDSMLYSAFADQRSKPAVLRETALFFYRPHARRETL